MKSFFRKITDGYLLVFPFVASLDLINRIFGVAPVDSWLTPAAVVALILVAAKIAVYRSVRKELSQVREAVKGSLRLLFEDMNEILFADDPERKREQFKQLLTSVSTYMVPLAGTAKTTQAQVFLVRSHGDHDHFYPSSSSNGVFSKARYSNKRDKDGRYLDESAAEVWQAAIEGRPRFYPNLTWRSKLLGDKPFGWKRFALGRRYSCFITVPLLSGSERLAGLLTINSTRPRALTEADVEVVSLIADTIQIADRDVKFLDALSGFDVVCSKAERQEGTCS